MNTSINSFNIKMDGEKVVNIDYLQLKKASLILRAINHELRQRILQLLDERVKLTVTQIYVTLRLEQSVASQHLATLRRSGVVRTTRSGKLIYYQLDHERMARITSIVEELLA